MTIGLSRQRTFLNAITESTFLQSSGMLFKSRTADGRKELD